MLEIEQLRIDSFYIILSFYQILLSSRILVFYCIEYIYIYIFFYILYENWNDLLVDVLST